MSQVDNFEDQTNTSYSFCYRQYWCHTCRSEVRLSYNLSLVHERFCEVCTTVLEIVPLEVSDHPRNYQSDIDQDGNPQQEQ